MSSKSKVDIDTIDSLFIAQHILTKLNLFPNSEQLKKAELPINRRVQSTIEAIEKIEAAWQYKAKSSTHTFGRKEKGETIKLWSVPRKSAQVLRNLVVLTGAKNILEVGTSAGYSTLFLADGAKLNDGQVVTIELLKNKATLARQFFDQSDLTNIKLLEDEAGKVLEHQGWGPIDLVFLDADKENYGKYLDLLLPCMNQGALIIADNINDYGHMMEDYLQRVTGTHLPKSRTDKRVISYYLAALDNGLMITRKI